MNNYRLYIGLNIADGTDWQREDAVNVIVSICKAKGITALFLSDCVGVYTYDNGKTVEESTLVLTLIDTDIVINDLCLALKSALRQECVMVERLADNFSFI